MFRILKNVVRVNSTEKEILLGVEFTFTLCAYLSLNHKKDLNQSKRFASSLFCFVHSIFRRIQWVRKQIHPSLISLMNEIPLL